MDMPVTFWTVSVPLLVGWLLDLLLGDPVWLPHPVVWFGKAISLCERKLNLGSHRKVKGAIVAVTLVAAVFVITWFMMYIMPPSGRVGLGAVFIFFCLAGHTLRKEVRMVFEAVDRGLDVGRQQVARIVGRDTSELSAQEVRTAALETLAENLSDGVVAPLFWYALLGVPGMMAYKMVNTLDSMIGYKTERYKDFGCWAARIDDIANYIPSRLTALLMVSSASFCPFRLLRFVYRYGPCHASPNSGYPEAALAGILDCQFGGPHYYFGQLFPKPFIGTNPRLLTTADMRLSLRIAFLSELLAIVIILPVTFFL